MTKNEAREYFKDWFTIVNAHQIPLSKDGEAVLALYEESHIAQRIRDVAVNWPDDMEDSYCKLCCSFLDRNEENIFLGFGVDPSNELWFQRRTFMLFVAEALE